MQCFQIIIVVPIIIISIVFTVVQFIKPINKIRIFFTSYSINRDEQNYLTGLYALTCEFFKRPVSTLQTCYQFVLNWYLLKYVSRNGNCDLFYHARANYYSKNKKAAEALCHFRENVMKVFRYDLQDRIITQEANLHGRNMQNPMKYYGNGKGIPYDHYKEFQNFDKNK